ncbi:MAG: DNA polymerase III subunit gamma/tau [Flavobacteriales bacterium]|nr:DNA polymerase III subunit gamma/tau [Flavobacteriales bacterium]
MDQFVVSARKYRPMTFDTVVGQSAITDTLKNAMKNNHMAQAFLFCGPRGVGKTTCARILAKVINCEKLSKNIEPCNTCTSCKSFNDGQSLNILELDAASNNSVDDIRNLIDQVRFAPQLGTHKVYIIDEVHMLSTQAFNAFLKTLEEPPAHAIFILATTEKHKIIPTILSRCQIFDFKRIQIEDIASHLESIAGKEKIETDPDGLHIIAQKADGALRDALSIFDQIVSFSNNKVTYDAVIENLNILDYDFYFKVTDAVLASSIPEALLIFDNILGRGFNGHNFIIGLAEHFRNLLVCQDVSTLQLLEVGEKIKERYKEQSSQCDAQVLLMALNVCNKCDISYKTSKNQRLAVELAIMQLCSIKSSLEKKNPDVTEIDITLDFVGGRSIQASASELTKQQATIEVASSVIATPKVAEPKPVYKASNPLQNKPLTSNSKKPMLGKGFLGGGGISIKADLQAGEKKAKTELEEDLSAKPTAEFSIAQLLPLWKDYAKKVRAEKKESLYTTLVKYNPSILENFVIEFSVENKVQYEDITRETADLLGFLRKKLTNYSISIKPVIIQQELKDVAYTSVDKFNRMAEKNPTLLKLKERFDLDIDY